MTIDQEITIICILVYLALVGRYFLRGWVR